MGRGIKCFGNGLGLEEFGGAPVHHQGSIFGSLVSLILNFGNKAVSFSNLITVFCASVA